jgi:hypothetical protein
LCNINACDVKYDGNCISGLAFVRGTLFDPASVVYRDVTRQAKGLYRLKYVGALRGGLAYLSRCNSGWFCHKTHLKKVAPGTPPVAQRLLTIATPKHGPAHTHTCKPKQKLTNSTTLHKNCGRTNLNYTDSSTRGLAKGLPRTSNGIILLVCRVTSR